MSISTANKTAHSQIDEDLLQRTAGPYNGVKLGLPALSGTFPLSYRKRNLKSRRGKSQSWHYRTWKWMTKTPRPIRLGEPVFRAIASWLA